MDWKVKAVLQLEIRDNTLNNYMNPFKVKLDGNPLYTDGLQYTRFRGRQIYNKYLGCPELPYIFNFGKVHVQTMIMQPNAETNISTDVLNTVMSSYEVEALENPEEIFILRMFAYNYSMLDDYFEDRDYVVEKENNIATLFNKTMTDATERNSVWDVPNVGARVIHHKEAHIIVEVVNYDDVEQASDYFLLLGILPMIYPNMKEKLSDEEIRYIKELVRRSQVKRIRNVEVENYFYAVYRTSKYNDAMKDLKLKAELENIVRMRTNRARNMVNNLLNTRDNLLRQYEDTLRDLTAAQKNLFDLESNDSFMDEVKLVMDMPIVKDLRAINEQIRIELRVPVEFYDPELLEINLDNNEDVYDCTPLNVLLREIFVDGKYKYNVGNAFYFRLDTGNLQLPRDISYSDMVAGSDVLFNPHIEFYGCYGDNQRALVETHQSKDLVGFVNAAIVALKNINFADSPVFSRWYSNLRPIFEGNYQWDRNFLTAKALENIETHENISISQWYERYKQREAENAPEIDVHEAGETTHVDYEDEEDDL